MREPYKGIDFFTSFEAANYIGRGVLLEADIAEGVAGETARIVSRHHIGGGAYELRIVWDNRPEEELRINRTRLLRFFRLRQRLSGDAER